ncbi:unnamed protein product [Sphagnum troendelagicum]|uniref:Cardiolipin synthase n=1 Tax=Sphagnum troendelagicum TaxID=128251 RepID=A0ABP0UV60_9BRYO
MRIPEGVNWAAVRQYLKATRASEYDRLHHQHHYHHHQHQQQQQQHQQTRLAAAAAAACCAPSSDQTVSTLTFLLFPFGSHVDSPGPNNNASSTSGNVIGRRNFFSSILTDSIFQRQPRDSLKSWIPITLLSSERRFFFLGPAVASSSSTTTNDVVLGRQQQHCLTRVSLNPPLPPPLGLSNHVLSEGRRLLVSSSRDPTSICSVFFFFFLKSQYSTASGPECGQQKQSRDYGNNYGQADANVGPSMQDDGSEVVGVGRDAEGSDCSKGHHHQGGSLHSEHEVSRTESETGWSREDVVNWPNAISVARLLSGPLLAGMILQGFPRAALIGLALAGASDWLDGFVARKLGVNSVLGSYLDPLADKVLVGSIALSMAYAGLLHPALVALVVARDVVLLSGSFIHRAFTLGWQWSGWAEFFKIGAGGAEKVEPLFISKVNTVLQLALIGSALMQPALDVVDTYSIVPILSWSVAATTSLSGIQYGWIYLRRPSPPARMVGGITHFPSEKSFKGKHN